ncbi:NAD(P)/FAD-dependent oxidoreductase [Microbacterium sp. A204]|uniref:NAD(P)/FAD-dependent oxidoreductase n=1 Tax=Microbacterium sp. A204 TaxID=3457321 RepID=UPI003FD0E600
MKKSVNAIVVGAGVMGVSAALHLLRAGASVILLERDSVADGTSGAGAGFVDPWTLGAPGGEGGFEEAAIADYGIEFYRSLHDLVPESPFRQRGLIWMAATEADWSYVEPRLTRGPADARGIEPSEIEEVTRGFVKARGVFRGVLRPRSAQISAERATRAAAQVFVNEGGDLRERTPALELVVKGGRIAGVRTSDEVIEADVVVVAAGAWTNRLLEPIGESLPIAPLVVSRIVTEPLGVPSDLPLLFIRAQATGLPRSYWLREEDGRLMFGTVYPTAARYSFVDQPMPDRLDQVDLDGVLEVRRGAEALAEAIPAVAAYRNMRLKHGTPGHTPDGRALVGALPGNENLYVLAGCNEQGVTNGPGFGRVIADLVMTGSTELADASVWNPARFGDAPRTARDVVTDMGPL